MTSGQVFKLACVLAYGGIVVLFMYFVHERGAGPHSVAARHIGRSQLINETDIVSIDRNDIVGHFALHEFEPDEKITAKDVSRSPVLPSTNVIAVVLSLDRPPRPIDVEDVQVCLDDKPIGKPSKPLASVCDAKTCVVTVPIGDSKELVGADAAKRLRAVLSSNQCANN
jgi:hypothetical protein